MKCIGRFASSGYSAAVLAGSLLIVANSAFGDTASGKKPESTPGQRSRAALNALPLSFEANRGQTDPSVKFLSRGDGYALFLTKDSAVFKLSAYRDNSAVVRMKLAGANAGAKCSGGEMLRGTVNYFIANDPSKWTTGAATYGKVNYRQIYQGIDLVYYGTQRQLEYDFVVAPGADPRQIALEFAGAEPRLGPKGSLVLTLDGAPLSFHEPVVYQMNRGKKELVAGSYKLAGGRVQFALGKYDHRRALVIDPVLNYLTYLGGSKDDIIGFPQYYGGSNATNPTQGVAVDSSGNVYVTGRTQSTDFPLQNPIQGLTTTIAYTGYVTKLNPAGSQLIYSTYFGGDVLHGNSETRPYGIAVDSSGSAYVTGFTSSPFFPVTAGAYQTVCGYISNFGDSCPNTQSAFLTKFSPNGSSLVYSTYLGHLNETGVAVAVDSQGRAYVAGNSSANCTTLVPTCFPTTANAVLPGSAFNNTVSPNNQQVGSAFISVFDAAGANLLYSSLYGYSDITTTNHGASYGVGVAVDTSGSFYLAGATQNNGLPVTTGAFQHYIGNTNPGLASPGRGFVAKFNPVSTGAALAYATYLGGTDPAQGAYSDGIGGIAADAAGNAYVSGNASFNFPVTAGAYNTAPCPGAYCPNRGFIAKINPAGTALVWATFVGNTSRPDLSAASSISPPRLDAQGNVYVSGSAGNNTQYPLVNPVQPANGFGGVYVTKFDPTGSTVSFSTVIYTPSNGGLLPAGVDIDTQGNIYVAGIVNATDLPVTAGAFQRVDAGGNDGFIAKINPLLSPGIGLVVAPGTANAGSPVTFTATVTGVAGKPTPTGAVNFMAGLTALGSGTLDASGVAILVSSAINGGNYSVTAVYVGDSTYSAATSLASPLTIMGSLPCSYSLSPNGEAFPAAGGAGNIAITVVAGCPWTVGALPPWVTLTSPPSGVGSGTVTFQIPPNSGGDLSGSFSIAGQTFTVEQAAAAISGLVPVGSLAQIASEGTWDLTLNAVNLGVSTATARFTFSDDNGNPLRLPLTFPQLPAAAGPELAATLDRTIGPNAQIVMESTGPDNVPQLKGSGQLLSNGNVSAFGIFSDPTFGWNALVPLETRNASKYILAFDNTANLTTGVAVANLMGSPANIQVIVRDEMGSVLGTPSISLRALGHTSFVLNPAPAGFPVTAGKRGTIEFDTPSGGQITVLGLRAYGTAALTTLPVLANVGPTGGSIAHIAYNGGFTSTFYIVNSGATSASFTLSFFDQNGNALSVPLVGVGAPTSAFTQTLATGSMLAVQTQANDAAEGIVGSAQLTTTGNIGGFEVFRWTTFNQEATVALETRSPKSFVLAFDDTNGLVTGLALANLAATTANVTVNFFDDTGAQLTSPASISLAPHAHTSFLLNDTQLGYPATNNKRGIIEFVVPPGGSISVIGLRAKNDGTLTTIPVLAR